MIFFKNLNKYVESKVSHLLLHTEVLFCSFKNRIENDFPTDLVDYIDWCKRNNINTGAFHSTLETYFRLKEVISNVNFSTEVPKSGAIVSHFDFFEDFKYTNLKKFILMVDRPYCNYLPHYITSNIRLLELEFFNVISSFEDITFLVQNPSQAITSNCRFIPPWPQIGLKKRKKAGLDTIIFCGYRINLDQRLQDENFLKEVANLGFKLKVVDEFSADKWSDFSDADIFLGIRELYTNITWSFKPPTKLYISWNAGLVAILGKESAFRAIRKSELDYFEADTEQDILSSLKKLRAKPNLFQEMVENGSKRKVEFSEQAITKIWLNAIQSL